MTSVRISGETDISAGSSTLLSSTINPSNANGNFEYSWESNNLSITEINMKNYSSAEISGLSEGYSTITLKVTQTLPSGEKITKSDQVDVIVKGRIIDPIYPSNSSGCNSGLFIIALLLVLPVLKQGSRG